MGKLVFWIVVAFAPGGTTDVLGRLIAAELSSGLGQSFVVENVSGGGGNIGSNQVAKAAPDGYSLLIGAAGNIAINPGLFTNMPYDPQTDLAPVALVASTANLLVVHPAGPAANVRAQNHAESHAPRPPRSELHSPRPPASSTTTSRSRI